MKSDFLRPQKPMRFKNPPIVEAVIALEVAPLPSGAIDDFQGGLRLMQEAGYQLPEPVTKHEVEIRFEGPSSSLDRRDSTPHGLKFISEDGLYAVQFNRDGLVFSRLERYEQWETFQAECRKVWQIYSKLSGVTEVTSYTVRYINKLYIPVGDDSEEYINIFPKLPGGIPNTILDCFMRLGLPITTPRGTLTHQQVLLPSDKEGYYCIVLDNIFQFPAIGMTIIQLWEEIEIVRHVKDYYFEQFTTEKMRETFDA